MHEEAACLLLPGPEFRKGGFSFVITFRSIASRDGVVPAPNLFRKPLERGEINDRQYRACSTYANTVRSVSVGRCSSRACRSAPRPVA